MLDDDLPKKILESLGYEVLPRPTSMKKEADFIVTYGSSRVFVEAKLKSDDVQKTFEKEQTLDQGEVFVSEATLGRNETISGVIRKASHQLRDSQSEDFNVLMYVAIGINARTKRDQIVDTIYGSTKIIEYMKPPVSKTCFFFRNSDFYRRKECLDAAIVGYYLTNNQLEIAIYLNPYSDRYESLKDSEFLRPFGKAVIDPILLEKSGEAYIPDADIDRKNPSQVLRNLENKYGIHPCPPLDFNSPEISIIDA